MCKGYTKSSDYSMSQCDDHIKLCKGYISLFKFLYQTMVVKQFSKRFHTVDSAIEAKHFT